MDRRSRPSYVPALSRRLTGVPTARRIYPRYVLVESDLASRPVNACVRSIRLSRGREGCGISREVNGKNQTDKRSRGRGADYEMAAN